MKTVKQSEYIARCKPAAKMLLETNLHPGVLKDMVCSPAGTTIDAVIDLEKNGFRHSVMSAVQKCTEKAIEMSKK